MAGKRLSRRFFERDAETVARELIGTILVHETPRGRLRARIVETEAYVGPHDLACHAAKGRTGRTEVMFGRGGHAYIYFIYGMYYMLNVVTGPKDDAQAVLIRAAEPLDGWDADLSGPGKLAKQFGILRGHNGMDMAEDILFIERGNGKPARVEATKRIGVDYAGEWKESLLRFIDAESSAVSKMRTTAKRRKKAV
jgi:DNA-3-methyladenine glycosylase